MVWLKAWMATVDNKSSATLRGCGPVAYNRENLVYRLWQRSRMHLPLHSVLCIALCIPLLEQKHHLLLGRASRAWRRWQPADIDRLPPQTCCLKNRTILKMSLLSCLPSLGAAVQETWLAFEWKQGETRSHAVHCATRVIWLVAWFGHRGRRQIKSSPNSGRLSFAFKPCRSYQSMN